MQFTKKDKIVKYNLKSIGFLTLVLAVTLAIVFYDYIFGDKLLVFRDIGSDTYEQYINQYASIINELKSGNWSMWDFRNGLGANMYTLNLFNPFLMVLYGIGCFAGTKAVLYLLVYLFMFEIIVAALCGYLFLSCFDFMEKTKIIVAIMYGFNGFLLVWGQHYQFGIICILLPLVLIMAERCIRCHKKWLGLVLAVAVCVMNSMYLAYMSLILTGFYVLLRCLWREKFQLKTYCKNIISLIWPMLLGIGIGAFSLIPSAAMIFGVSGRLESEQGLVQRLLEGIQLYPYDYYWTALASFFSETYEGIVQNYSGYANYYESPHLFFSAFFIIIGCQYVVTVFGGKMEKKKKALQILMLGLAGSSVVLVVFGIIFNGCTAPFSRFTFLLFPFFAAASAMELDRMLKEKKMSLPVLAASLLWIAVMYVLLLAGKPFDGFATARVLLLITSVSMGILLFFLVGNKKGEKTGNLLWLFLCVVLVIHVGGETYTSFYERDNLEKDDREYFDNLYSADVQDALQYLRENDETFYRVEKNYGTTKCMDAMVQNYSSISTYNSTVNEGVKKFAKVLWPNYTCLDDNHFEYTNVVHETAQVNLLGVKYLISKNDRLQLSGFEKLKEFGQITLYENKNITSIATLLTETINSETLENWKRVDMNHLLPNAAVVADLDSYSLSQDDIGAYQMQEIDNLVDYQALTGALQPGDSASMVWTAGCKYEIPLKDSELSGYTEGIVMTFDMITDINSIVTFTTDDGAVLKKFVNGEKPAAYSIELTPDTTTIKMQYEQPEVTGQIANVHFYAKSAWESNAGKAEVQLFEGEKNLLEGQTEINEDGILMLALPYENGFRVFLNGQEQMMRRVDYGFIGIDVKQGSYEIEIEYHCPGLKEGLILSIGSSVLLLILLILQRRKRNNSIA